MQSNWIGRSDGAEIDLAVGVPRAARFGDAAGNDPPGMDALVAEEFNDVLTESTETDSGAAQFRPGSGNAEDVAHFGVGLHT